MTQIYTRWPCPNHERVKLVDPAAGDEIATLPCSNCSGDGWLYEWRDHPIDLWTGETDMQDALMILAASEEQTFTPEEERELLAFFGGDQWLEEIKQERPGRPCLVLNRLPGLLDQALARSRRALTPEEIRRLTLIITRRGRDSQLTYNYMASKAAEAAAGIALEAA